MYGRPYPPAELADLQRMWSVEGLPIEEISKRLDRTANSIRQTTSRYKFKRSAAFLRALRSKVSMMQYGCQNERRYG